MLSFAKLSRESLTHQLTQTYSRYQRELADFVYIKVICFR